MNIYISFFFRSDDLKFSIPFSVINCCWIFNLIFRFIESFRLLIQFVIYILKGFKILFIWYFFFDQIAVLQYFATDKLFFMKFEYLFFLIFRCRYSIWKLSKDNKILIDVNRKTSGLNLINSFLYLFIIF